MEEKELVVPHTIEELLDAVKDRFEDKVSREPLAGMWDYGVEAGQQMVIDYMEAILNAEFINDEDESLLSS